MDRTRTVLCLAVLAMAAPVDVSAQAPDSAAADTTRPTAVAAHQAPGTPAHRAPASPTHRAPAAPAHQATTVPAQALRVGEVLIEGKLYSPQALFILSRPEERFERDVVVPHVLQMQRATTLLPYRLRPEVLAAQRAALDATNSTPAPIVPRRSP